MTTIAVNIPSRGRFRGVGQIIAFNWPQYIAAVVTIVLLLLLSQLSLPTWVTITLIVGAALTAFWLVSSILASWWIYDLSSLMRWDWIVPLLKRAPRSWVNLHAGLDESSVTLAQMFPGSTGRAFDFFTDTEMTEGSIHRARRACATRGECVNYRAMPAADGEFNAAFVLFALHELRTAESRQVLLRELHRIVAPDGRIILAEHLRDLPNFIAFGPGFLHFHSRRTWLGDFQAANLTVEHEFSITPFTRVFVLRRPS